MTLTTSTRIDDREPSDTEWVTETARPDPDDTIVVTCGTCDSRQDAPGRAPGFTCVTCGSAWQVLRCRGCRRATMVLTGTTACPRCGHEHRTANESVAPRVPTWLVDPDPLSVWLGGVKYLGGHAERDQPVAVAGLLLDRRGVHLRAFSELFSIGWDTITGIGIEGPLEISERMTTSHLLALGATTWAMSVAYLTIRTTDGDAIFEVGGIGPPQLHARLSRVLQGLQRVKSPPAPSPLDRGEPVRSEPVAPEPVAPEPDSFVDAEPHTPVDIDPEHSAAPLEVLVIDGLWKLARLRELGLLDDAEVTTLRAQLLARVSEAAAAGTSPGPLLHV